MKIYHTETQEDYDALMFDLKTKGIDTLPEEHWKNNECDTVVFVRGIDKNLSHRIDTTYGDVAWAIYKYPDTPIIKYKAKADEKMKFTKENVEKVMDQHLKETEDSVFADIVSDIYDMDDTPEKVVVPKFVAEWIEWNKESEVSLQVVLNCYEHFCGNRNPNCQTDGEKAVQWYVDNPYKFIKAYEDGYTIEPGTTLDPRYTVIIADRYLVQLFIGGTEYRFVEFDELCAWKPSAFQLTEVEIKAIDERYWAFAGPVKEEEE